MNRLISTIAALIPLAVAAETIDVGNFANPTTIFSGKNGENAPIVAASKHSATQIIYPADQLVKMRGKQLQSISFKYNSESAGSYATSLKIYIKETPSTSYEPFSGNEEDLYYWSRIDDGYEYITQEFSNGISAGDGELTLDLSKKPFLYIGNSLMITVISDSQSTSPILFYSNKSEGSSIKALTYANDSKDYFAHIADNGNTAIHQDSDGAKLTDLPVARFIYGEYSAENAFSGGKGTTAEPYLISNSDDILLLDQWTNAEKTRGLHFLLTNDLKLPTNLCIGTIGDFTGTFDGGGHCITVDLKNPSKDYAGLFLSTADATICNLQVDGNVSGSMYTGGIVGASSSGCTFTNLANHANVISFGYGMGTGGIIGAIVSSDGNGCKLTHCTNYGDVNGYTAGGVIGYSGQRVGNEISIVANYGKINSEGSRSAGVIANPMFNDQIRCLLNFGTTSNNSLAATVGAPRSSYSDQYYDMQTFYTTAYNEYQARLTREIIDDGLKSDAAGSDMSEDNWLFADGMLPRIKMGGIENSQRAILYSTPIVLADDNNVTAISKPFKVGIGNGVEWTSLNGCVEITADGTATPVKEGGDMLIASLGGYERTIEIKITENAGINSTDSDKNIIFGRNNEIVMNFFKPADVVIFNLQGAIVERASYGEGVHSLPVEKGCYIAKSNSKTYKVIVN